MEQPGEFQESPQEDIIFNDADLSMQEYNRYIRGARIFLLIIACMQLLQFLIHTLSRGEIHLFATAVHSITAIVFVGLTFWIKQKPFPAMLTACIVYGVAAVLLRTVQDFSLGYAIGWHTAALVLLVQGMQNVRAAEKVKKK